MNGIGSVKSTSGRRRIFEQFQRKRYRFASVIHPAATIATDARLLEGVQVMAGAVVQPGVLSVSYTHLDVYKRQDLARLRIFLVEAVNISQIDLLNY